MLGEVIRDLGGGRLIKESPLDPEVGLDHLVKPGEAVQPGSVLCRIHAARKEEATAAALRAQAAYEIGEGRPEPAPLVVEVVEPV